MYEVYARDSLEATKINPTVEAEFVTVFCKDLRCDVFLSFFWLKLYGFPNRFAHFLHFSKSLPLACRGGSAGFEAVHFASLVLALLTETAAFDV